MLRPTGSYTWTVSLPAGTNITLQVRDGTGAVNYGSPVVVQPGTSDSCVDQAAASSATAAGGAVGGGASSTAAGSSAASSTSAAASGSSLVSSTGSVTSVFVYSSFAVVFSTKTVVSLTMLQTVLQPLPVPHHRLLLPLEVTAHLLNLETSHAPRVSLHMESASPPLAMLPLVRPGDSSTTSNWLSTYPYSTVAPCVCVEQRI